jgi:hypothetical protein
LLFIKPFLARIILDKPFSYLILKYISIFLLSSIIFHTATGQAENSTEQFKVAAHERDLIDLAADILKNPSILKRDTARKKTGRIYFSGSPSPGYSLSSGWAAIIVANGAFYTSEDPDAKISNVYTDAVYTQMQQFVFHLQSNIWTRHNKYNIVNDWRFYSYPQRTYGLGANSDVNDFADQDYHYIRLNQTILRTIAPNLFAGIGYGIDYHYNISQTGNTGKAMSDINAYGVPPSSTSAGLNFAFLFDDRVNSINPWGGSFVNIVYRPNMTALGSDTNWQSLLVDLRKYVPFPANSQNILAFWNYNWITLSGNPPYLDLPSTGWDSYSNVGRGYIQGRFRSKNLLYFETEYRFRVTHSGLIGGVVFANAQAVSDWPSNTFQSIKPAAGFGVRLKFNKYSRTNVAIDYGFGTGGSQGIFVNLGEVF